MAINFKDSIDAGLKLRGMTRNELALKMGCSRMRIYHIREQKNISTTVLESLAKALDMKPSEFIALSED